MADTKSLDLNSIEILWIDVERYIKQQKPKNIEKLYNLVENTATRFPPRRRDRGGACKISRWGGSVLGHGSSGSS